MAGFLRKVAGAFVHLEDDDDDDSTKNPPARGNLDELTSDASALIAQLDASDLVGEDGEDGQDREMRADRAQDAPAGGSRSPGRTGRPATAALTSMTAEQVFAAAQLANGPNSAQRVLKLLAGLSMFPPEQQIVMVRAMDAADEAWSEAEVLEDARMRVAVPTRHIQDIDREQNGMVSQLRERIAATQTDGQALVSDIDARIAELQAQREQALVGTTKALDALEGEIQAIDAATQTSRRGIQHVIHALSSLIGFFTGGQPSSPQH